MTELKRNRGRPLMGASPTRPVNVTLCREDLELAADLGAGNVSKGIRIALDDVRKTLGLKNNA